MCVVWVVCLLSFQRRCQREKIVSTTICRDYITTRNMAGRLVDQEWEVLVTMVFTL